MSAPTSAGDHSQVGIAYLHTMLGELRQVAQAQRADMLCYLIEMAYVEAGDILAGRRQLSAGHADRNKPAGMPM